MDSSEKGSLATGRFRIWGYMFLCFCVFGRVGFFLGGGEGEGEGEEGLKEAGKGVLKDGVDVEEGKEKEREKKEKEKEEKKKEKEKKETEKKGKVGYNFEGWECKGEGV
ncbi:uncharacterized protein EAF01_011510 [Botrytis porri]|uniref:uncharacterized protein n=1 Tax=Botrytis porri TaxID=87229 RepID=UPI0018FFDD17|nr:uncharacterized protein EAF01_011510 [Botrytis porri]KAF7884087.1 hypothetical protein EAF01_011510 [Botrytis porri]